MRQDGERGIGPVNSEFASRPVIRNDYEATVRAMIDVWHATALQQAMA